MSFERREYRLEISDVERALALRTTVVLSQHQSETREHVTLRVLAYCLLYQDGIAFGPGVSLGDAADLEARDLTGKVALWVGCGDVPVDLVRKVAQHHRDAAVHLVFAEGSARDAFFEALERAGRPARGWERVSVWTIDERLVAVLAAREELRQRWAVTIVGDHFYVDVDGTTHDGAVTLATAAPRSRGR